MLLLARGEKAGAEQALAQFFELPLLEEGARTVPGEARTRSTNHDGVCERPSWAMNAQQEQRSHGGSGMLQ